MSRIRAALAVVATTALLAPLGVVAAPAASAADAYQAVTDASAAKAKAAGGATINCMRVAAVTPTNPHPFVGYKLRYSAGLTSFQHATYNAGQSPYVVLVTPTLTYRPVVSRPVNALDTAYQRAIAASVAAHAHIAGTPRWYSWPSISGDPGDLIAASAFAAMTRGGIAGLTGEPTIVTPVDATHWRLTGGGHGYDGQITTTDGVITAIDDGPRPDGTYGAKEHCTFSYGPSGYSQPLGLAVPRAKVPPLGLFGDLTGAVRTLQGLRSTAGRALASTQSSRPLVVAAKAMAASLRASDGSAWTAYRITAPTGYYVVTLVNPTANATVSWRISRANYRAKHFVRAAVVHRLGLVTVLASTPLT